MGEPTDPDVDLHVPVRRPGSGRTQIPVAAVVALGGAIGASARYGASLLWPTAAGGLPWTTLGVNAVGCAVIGVFMVVISEVWVAHRLVRPFFGTGVLGGFTTFSTYAVDIQQLVDGGRARTGLAYLGLTLLLALVAVWSAAWATRRIVTWRQA
ncbi:putative fluoride ion transporter CrcB 1 [Streptomyces sulfonofaciens]|uniref:Fluoride-specific ion channel FluC n=1 Tax=Streptomyces sulfonofaciens TaxID=68272 RepID=A0A919KV92_9ACTN|nr:fluoride efflux transporter CrcB [Streptomyces sulfonofaciens]GHH72941.1 putative fluoride ion transporter CrcB 1 [Streptomyces sulfonofaciens]